MILLVFGDRIKLERRSKEKKYTIRMKYEEENSQTCTLQRNAENKYV